MVSSIYPVRNNAPPAWPEPLPPCSRTVAAGRRGEGPLEFLTGFTL